MKPSSICRWKLPSHALSLVLLLGIGCTSCQPSEPAVSESASSSGPIDYSFGTVDGQIIGSAMHRGRVTVLLFITTFDLASQAQAKRLEDLSRLHTPRLNALGVALEPPQNIELARTFAQTLELHFPLAMADANTLAGKGPWGTVNAVPTWVLLDKQGRLKSAFFGSMSPSELTSWVRTAE